MNEFALIEALFKPLGGARSDVILGIGDDGAVVRPLPGEELVIVADTLVAGVHFPAELDPTDIGYRAVAVNLSDIAAMGAEPRWATLALTVPDNDERWLGEFARGLHEALAPFHSSLIGGDTTRGPLTITVQIIGGIPTGQALTRHGARPGDLVCVSGTLGDAAGGLALLQRGAQFSEAAKSLINRFARPSPRVSLGVALRGVATSCIDISDGLLADVGHLAERSHCGAEIQASRIPRSTALSSLFEGRELLTLAATGGDDYELCFTVPSDRMADLMATTRSSVPLYPIGVMTAAPGIVSLLDTEGRPMQLPTTGYRHFND
ncbi:MAG: thiamine-phosphate kinase [Gammaproteobacteria bacterium]|nr:thiamine-phosphate kinase [Gammaproteobacteria bacterium]